MADPAYLRRVEAVLFAAAEPLTPADITAHAGAHHDVRTALAALTDAYAGRGINLVERGGRWHFQTAPDLAGVLAQVCAAPRPLGRAASETLAIVAYHQPVSRAEIEAVRGVAVSPGTLDTLIESGWVRLAGRRDTPGRPLTYATTPAFLAAFGLTSLRDLPGAAELRDAGLLGATPPLSPDVNLC